MSDDETERSDAIAEAVTDQWERRGGEFDPGDYAWALVSCPHCETGMFLGVHDPDWTFDGESADMVTLAPPDPADDAEAED